MAGTQRPSGVAVLSILIALGGILSLLGAVFIGILAGTWAEALESLIEQYGAGAIPGIGGFLSGILAAIAVVAAIIGILMLIDAYGLWAGKSWAWWLTIVLSFIGIILGLLSLPGGIITIAIDILIIYYFTRPHVKEFFGLSAPSPPPSPP